ncbi:MAG: AAA family ATPase [Clostridiales bacterium]|jgi:hypothetical protein|nr:AAA family ATPase [Clostridiales bacterium]
MPKERGIRRIITEMTLRIPYCVSDFRKIATGNFAYVDKTPYIEKLEDEVEYALFLRPRRFGKSMLLSMLEYYYDYKYDSDFNSIFGKTWIGANPTSLKNSFAVLKLDFSGVNVESKTLLHAQFSSAVESKLGKFVKVNGLESSFSGFEYKGEPSEFTNAFLERFESITEFDKPIYLLIDEYDHYANALLGQDTNHFKAVMGASGFIRAFYEVLKKHTTNGAIEKIFITGIAPITMDSLTSGFNISDDLTRSAMFHDMAGFTHDEVNCIIGKTLPWLKSQQQSLHNQMAMLYNGYRFSCDALNMLFNSGMALYYLKECRRQRVPPKELLDKNVISDYSKIKALASIDLGEQEESSAQQIEEAKINRLSVMKAIAVGESQPADLTVVFELKKFDENYFLTLLFYTGYLTLSVEDGKEVLIIPNAVFKNIYLNYFSEMVLNPVARLQNASSENALAMLANDGNTDLFVQSISHILSTMDFRTFIDFDEASLARVAHQIAYGYTGFSSSIERHIADGYIDHTLLPGKVPVKHYALIEYKYVIVKNLSLKSLESAWNDAFGKLSRYGNDVDFKELNRAGTLKKWIIIFSSHRCLVNQEVNINNPDTKMKLIENVSLPKIIAEMKSLQFLK